jgi:hypothetical protein
MLFTVTRSLGGKLESFASCTGLIMSLSGCDLDVAAYRHTNGLPGFSERLPPYPNIYFQLISMAHCLSFFHYDIAVTWLFVSGPGEIFWIRSRSPVLPRESIRFRDIIDSYTFEDWQPDQADIDH